MRFEFATYWLFKFRDVPLEFTQDGKQVLVVFTTVENADGAMRFYSAAEPTKEVLSHGEFREMLLDKFVPNDEIFFDPAPDDINCLAFSGSSDRVVSVSQFLRKEA